MIDAATLESLSVNGPEIVVSTPQGLRDAMAQLSESGGGTIRLSADLEPDHYVFYQLGTDAGEILIVPEDPDNPPTLEGMRFVESQNVTVAGLRFDGSASDRPDWHLDFMTSNSSDISVIGNVFDGPATEMMTEHYDIPTEQMGGLLIRNTDGFEFTGNHVSGYTHGLTLREVQDAYVADNEFTELQGDGLNGGGWQNVTIENNWFHDMLGSYHSVGHPDFIQLWGDGVKSVTDGVWIRNNFMDAGDGPAYQSILVQNKPGATPDEFMRNITIEDNVIHNGVLIGIRVQQGTQDVSVLNNTVLWNKDAVLNMDGDTEYFDIPSIYVRSVGEVNVSGNIAGKYDVRDGIDITDNVTLSYRFPSDENYIGNHFVMAQGGGSSVASDLELLPDSQWAGMYGAAMTQPSSVSGDLLGVVRQIEIEGMRDTMILDASLSRDPTGYIGEAEADFTWTFEDGTTAEGIQVVHDFGEQSGDVPVTLTIRKPGFEASFDKVLYVRGNEIAAFDFDDTSDFDLFKDAPEITGGFDGNGIHVGGSDRAGLYNDPDFHHLETFSLSLVLEKDTAGSSGRVLDMNEAMWMTIDGDGKVKFALETEDGRFIVDSGDVLIGDTEAHRFDVVYSNEAGVLQLYVDGGLAGETAATGTTEPPYYHGMYLGTHRWHDSIEGTIDDFEMRADARSADDVQAAFEDQFGTNAAPHSMTPTPIPEPQAPSIGNGTVPDEEEPQEPVSEEPEEPVLEEPAEEEPQAEQPPEPTPPVAEEEPVEEQPEETPQEEPVAEEPQEPVAEEPQEPVAEEPQEPSQEGPEEPVAEEPQEPVAEEPQEPESSEAPEPAPAEDNAPPPAPEPPVVNDEPPQEEPVVEPPQEEPAPQEPVAEEPEDTPEEEYADEHPLIALFNILLRIFGGEQDSDDSDDDGENDLAAERIARAVEFLEERWGMGTHDGDCCCAHEEDEEEHDELDFVA